MAKKDSGRFVEEFLLGGISTSLACFFTNPAEVVKTRMQLQGELKAKGTYHRHYRNFFHACWTIGKVEGWLALQKGLGPALVYQFVMNGVRLGTFQTVVNMGLTKDTEGQQDFGKTVVAGAVAGCFAGMVGSPFYMVKTHLQAMSTKEIAVGHQYRHKGMIDALLGTYRAYGLRGLWRGVEGAVPRLMIGSALQLSTFSWIKEHVKEWGWVSEVWVPVVASVLSSFNIVVFMEPLDVVRTRIYNQPIDSRGKGLYYTGFIDCFVKIGRAEGIQGFYKGAWAAFFRMAPQAILGLSIWDSLRRLYKREYLGDS